MTFKEYFYLIKKREAIRLLNIKGYLIRRADRELN